MRVTQTRRGAVIVVTAAAGVLILVAAAYGCVPQRGSIVAEGPTGGPSSTVVGDGTSDRHFNGWCEHPTDAAYAAEGDTVTFTVDDVTAGSVSPNCPEVDNELPNGQTYVYVENDDVYDWNDTAGYWDFAAGDGVGCYHANANPVLQHTFTYNGGQDTESFTLDGMTQANTHDGDLNPEPGEDASVLCVGENVSKGSDAVAIFVPLVVTSI